MEKVENSHFLINRLGKKYFNEGVNTIRTEHSQLKDTK